MTSGAIAAHLLQLRTGDMTHGANTELLLRVNGIEPAFGIEFGLPCPRADQGRRDPYRQANVSYSLLQRHGGQVVRHTLIDVGMGVVPSLLEFEVTHGVHVVDEVVLTHPHFDHYAQLDWLSMALLRNGRPEQPRPLPVYASRACWETGPARTLKHLADRTDFRPLEDAVPVALDDVRLTPVAVDHGPTVPGAMGFLLQHGSRRIFLSGDFYRVLNEENPLLFGMDVAFLEANNWHPVEGIWHQSVLGDLELVHKWRPKRTYLIHYSGYEDRDHPDGSINGPMTLQRLRNELAKVARGLDVRPALHGMVLGDGEPWPE